MKQGGETVQLMQSDVRKSGVPYIIIASIISTVFLISAAAKGIAPFGQNVFEGGDFAGQTLPYYYHVWDVLHGKAPLFYDWNSGFGNSFIGVDSHFSLLNPLILFFCFWRREDVTTAATFYVLLRLILIAWSMCYFLRHDHVLIIKPVSAAWMITASFGYALNAYTTMYWGFGWMDIGTMLPFLVLSYHGMMQECREGKAWKGNTLCYILQLFLICFINLPQAYAVCLFLIAYAGGWFFIRVRQSEYPKGQRYAGAARFCLSSVLAVGCSGVFLVPVAKHIQASERGSMNGYIPLIDTYRSCMTIFGTQFYLKWIIAGSLAVPAVLFWYGTVMKVKGREGRPHWTREESFRTFLFFTAVAPVVFERINLLWHNGPYVMFPMRYAYIMAFILIVLGTNEAAAGEEAAEYHRGTLYRLSARGLALCWLLSGCFLAYHYMEYTPKTDDYDLEAGIRKYYQEHELTELDRVKDVKGRFSGCVWMRVGVPGLTDYFSLNSRRQAAYVIRIGHPNIWMNYGDKGGTVFSDALEHVEYPLEYESADLQNSLYFRQSEDLTLYAAEENINGYQIYKNCYVYPVGMFVSYDSFQNMGDGLSQQDALVNQNILSRGLIGEELIDVTEESTETIDEAGRDYSFDLEGNRALYFYCATIRSLTVSYEENDIDIRIDETEIPPTEDYQGIVPLGNYKDANVKVHIYADHSLNVGSDFCFGSLDLDRFRSSVINAKSVISSFSIDGSEITFTADAGEKGYIFLPVYADEGWQYYLDGVQTSIHSVDNMFMMLPVSEGQHTVRLRYRPDGMGTGIIITLLSVAGVGLFSFLGYLLTGRQSGRAFLGTLNRVAGFVFGIVFATYMVLFVIYPILYTWVVHIRQIL